jgi:ribosome-binding protein aMBF1 (putative translation factor)
VCRDISKQASKNIRIWDIIPSSDIIRQVKGIPQIAEEKLQHLIRRIREEAGVTQAGLAARLRVPQSAVSKFESGERRLDILELRQICRELGISLADFVRRLEKEVP